MHEYITVCIWQVANILKYAEKSAVWSSFDLAINSHNVVVQKLPVFYQFHNGSSPLDYTSACLHHRVTRVSDHNSLVAVLCVLMTLRTKKAVDYHVNESGWQWPVTFPLPVSWFCTKFIQTLPEHKWAPKLLLFLSGNTLRK